MKTPDWDRIQEIYHEARKLPRSEQRAFVETVCDGNPVLAGEIMELLAVDDAPFLNTPILNLPLAPSVVGTTISERYYIEKELGRGGMSEVYLARDRKVNDRAVVIKFLSLELLENSFARKKFKQESEALSRIHHAGVVQVLDKDELPDGRPYFVMEFVDGEMLRSQISSNGMNLERAASILKQIGTALEQAHQQGVFHRDLKPENILLRRDTEDVVLIDFGIAKVTDSVVAPTTTDGQSAGTLMYMSPEQLRRENVTAASDIYSLGVIAYEMVTGRRPFNTTSSARLLELQKKGVRVKPTRLREELSTKAEALILRALSFDSSARYERASEFGDNVAEALLVSGVAPEKPSFKVVAAYLLILVALISLGLYIIIRRPPKPEPNRSFSYFLTVQTTRDGKEYQAPFKSNGSNDTFDNGDKFRLTVSTPVPAYLYIFNEGPPDSNDSGFKMIYPNQATNKGSASLGANQSVQSDWITFRGPAGDENLWIVWSTAPVSELDAVTNEAFKNDGGLTGQTLATVKQYLTTKKSEIDATTYHYNANQTAVVRGRRDLLVTLAQFKHR
jgi:serine/threonine protein kinase